MKQKCQACGIEKDSGVKEVYPYPDDGIVDHEPIDPFFTLDCQGPSIDGVTAWRSATVCHDCFHRLNPDMWISERCWQALRPVISFEQLPNL